MELSCSSVPSVSVHSNMNLLLPHPHRRVSLYNHRRSRKVVSFLPNSTSSSFTSASTSCSSSASCSSSYFGVSLSNKFRTSLSRQRSKPKLKSKRPFYIIAGVFEKFTERAIKAVMFSQREARALGKDMVFTQHLLLGLIAEDRSSSGFLGSGITISMARQAVLSIWNDYENNHGIVGGAGASSITSATDVPFSISTKRVFEAAVEYSRTMGYNFIAPEHIAIGLFTVDDGSASRVLKRYIVNMGFQFILILS